MFKKIGKTLQAIFDGNKLLGYKMLDKDFDFDLYDISELCEAP